MSDSLSRTIRIATRSSRLAVWQAEHIARLLRESDPGCAVELVRLSTIGDRDRVSPLAGFGGQGAFTREVQQAVHDGRADLAVHSLKDLPTVPTPGLALAGVPARAPRFDLLILPRGATALNPEALPPAARIGTGSPRRRAQLLHARPDLQMRDIRGNVETRLNKLDAGEYDAVILAAAGLERLALAEWPTTTLGPPLMFPAVGQAAIGVECRADDGDALARLEAITDPLTWAEATAERMCLLTLRAGCHAPVGVLTERSGDELTLTGVVLSTDGRQRIAATRSGPLADAADIGRRTAGQLLTQGAAPLISGES